MTRTSPAGTLPFAAERKLNAPLLTDMRRGMRDLRSAIDTTAATPKWTVPTQQAVLARVDSALTSVSHALDGTKALGGKLMLGDAPVRNAGHARRELERAKEMLGYRDVYTPARVGETLREARIRLNLAIDVGASSLRSDRTKPRTFDRGSVGGDGSDGGSHSPRGYDDWNVDPVTGMPPRAWEDPETGETTYPGTYLDGDGYVSDFLG